MRNGFHHQNFKIDFILEVGLQWNEKKEKTALTHEVSWPLGHMPTWMVRQVE